jgi:hypothetical protein
LGALLIQFLHADQALDLPSASKLKRAPEEFSVAPCLLSCG